jgi:hypothetical protein
VDTCSTREVPKYIVFAKKSRASQLGVMIPMGMDVDVDVGESLAGTGYLEVSTWGPVPEVEEDPA